jgi:hypothetical protein
MAAWGLACMTKLMNCMAASLFLAPRGTVHQSMCTIPWFHSQSAFAPSLSRSAMMRAADSVVRSISPSVRSCTGCASTDHHTFTCGLMRDITLKARSMSIG